MGKGENKVKSVPCLFLCRLQEYIKAHTGLNPRKKNYKFDYIIRDYKRQVEMIVITFWGGKKRCIGLVPCFVYYRRKRRVKGEEGRETERVNSLRGRKQLNGVTRRHGGDWISRRNGVGRSASSALTWTLLFLWPCYENGQFAWKTFSESGPFFLSLVDWIYHFGMWITFFKLDKKKKKKIDAW